LLKEWVLNYFLVAKAVVPYMIQRKAGRIVFSNILITCCSKGKLSISHSARILFFRFSSTGVSPF
jgi:hypothetical protein